MTLVQAAGFTAVTLTQDLGEQDRVVSAQKPV
jgi:hypothetical protein